MAKASLETARQYLSNAIAVHPTIFDGLECHEHFDDISTTLSIDKNTVLDAYKSLPSSTPDDENTRKLQSLAESEGFTTILEFAEQFSISLTVPGIYMNADCSYTSRYEPDQECGWCELCNTSTVCSVSSCSTELFEST